MLKFEPYSFELLKRALPFIKTGTSFCSDLSAGSLFMWQDGSDLQFCFWNDTLVMRQTIGEQLAFTWPVGADVYGMVDELIDYVRENDLALRFYEVDDTTLKTIESDARLKPAMSEYEIRWSDYIYSFEETMTFKGNKYKGQRNHINKFKRLYGEPVIRFIEPENYDAVIKMLSEYQSEHKDANRLEKSEIEETVKLLNVSKELDLYAVCLTVDEKIAAFSIGEVIGDMLLIHVEKALTRYEGIYPTMYQSFVKFVAKQTGRVLCIVNREDDSGDEGLRISKMQYHPVGRVNKYLVHINSPAAKLTEIPNIDGGTVVLTPFFESDKKAYLKISTDINNNKFWGYDYREDEYFPETVDENTFYDSAMIDMHAGDSINFAVRTSPDGDMIGEAILWNFTANSAEAGCRIMPEYQGMGYGGAAFKTLSDFAEKILKVKVRARCFFENTASYRMIISSGYNLSRKDEKYCYFNRTAD